MFKNLIIDAMDSQKRVTVSLKSGNTYSGIVKEITPDLMCINDKFPIDSMQNGKLIWIAINEIAMCKYGE